MSLCLVSHQQLRSYGDGATVCSLIGKTEEAGDQTLDPFSDLLYFIFPCNSNTHFICSYLFIIIFFGRGGGGGGGGGALNK